MQHSTKLAFGIAIGWLAGVLFFVAFHPGGIKLSDGNPAGNPIDVLKYIMTQRGILGNFGKAGGAVNATPAAGGIPDTGAQSNVPGGEEGTVPDFNLPQA